MEYALFHEASKVHEHSMSHTTLLCSCHHHRTQAMAVPSADEIIARARARQAAQTQQPTVTTPSSTMMSTPLSGERPTHNSSPGPFFDDESILQTPSFITPQLREFAKGAAKRLKLDPEGSAELLRFAEVRHPCHRLPVISLDSCPCRRRTRRSRESWLEDILSTLFAMSSKQPLLLPTTGNLVINLRSARRVVSCHPLTRAQNILTATHCTFQLGTSPPAQREVLFWSLRSCNCCTS